MHRILFSAAVIVSIFIVLPCIGEAAEDSLTQGMMGFSADSPLLAAMVEEALHRNPSLGPASAAVKAAGELPVQAAAYPDPMVTLGVFAREVETRVGPQRGKVILGQTIPARGKRRARVAAARTVVSLEEAKLDLLRSRVARDVRNAFFDIYLTDRTLSAVLEDVELTGFHEALAVAGYQAGSSGYGDILRSQVAVGNLSDRARSLRELRVAQVIRLNTLLGRPFGQTLEILSRLEPEAFSIPAAESLAALVEMASPEIAVLGIEAEKMARGVDIARTASQSDTTYRLDYTPTSGASMPGVADSGKDPILATVSFTFPLDRDKYDAGIREAKARHTGAFERIEERRQSTRAELATAVFNFSDGTRKALLFRDSLIPKAFEAVRVIQESYRLGISNFSDLLDSQRTLLEFRLSMERAIAEAGKARALIGHLAGEAPPEPLDRRAAARMDRNDPARKDFVPSGVNDRAKSGQDDRVGVECDFEQRLELRMKAYRNYRSGRER